MGLNVKIDLRDVYEIVQEEREQRASAFDTILRSGEKVRLGVIIAQTPHPLMKNVYNLAFGPMRKDGSVNDKVRLSHRDHSKVFSTVALEVLSFLIEHPDKYVGINGSDYVRAHMYYRCIRNNFENLSTIFTIQGIKYYIRMLRQAEDGSCDFDEDDIITKYESITPDKKTPPEKLYNYFILNLKHRQGLASPI